MHTINYFDEFQKKEERKNLFIGFLFAILFHIFLLFLHLPKFDKKFQEILPEKKKITLIEIPISQKVEKIKKVDKISGINTIPTPVQTIEENEFNIKDNIEIFENFNIEPNIFEYLPKIPDPPTDDELLFVGADIQKPERLTQINPLYPKPAIKAGIEGNVILQLTIDKSGNVIDVKVIRGLPMGLTEVAIEEAKKQKFKPAYRKSTGLPVNCIWTITITFKLK